ncbi:MAG: hypothetical protein HUU32_18380 [Calditrichaceae bacterium]|nr:hypothetical protein [Calditrichia bacterium]NUQ43361.1 hypothetical protein [Calditrichaceae bacterium]
MNPFAASYASKLKVGDIVEVLPYRQILETLDENGQLENMPFMPEMLQYCGQQFRVYKRVNYVCIDGNGMRGLSRTVNLENIYCDGFNHDNCQRSCTLFWKDAWLKKCSDGMGVNDIQKTSIKDTDGLKTHVDNGKQYICQSTRLMEASIEVKGLSKISHLLRESLSGNRKFSKFLADLFSYIHFKLGKNSPKSHCQFLIGEGSGTSRESLNLQPGDWVEVKSKEEIKRTLDKYGKNRRLVFTSEMHHFCGKRFRVRQRLDKMISEKNGQMIQLKDTVLLEDVVCYGICKLGCSRYLHHWWREIWLRKV